LGQIKKMDLAAEPHASLTAREREIALLVARGLRNKAIASELQRSEGTVKVHLHNIFQKLSIKSRWVLMAQACDLLSPCGRSRLLGQAGLRAGAEDGGPAQRWIGLGLGSGERHSVLVRDHKFIEPLAVTSAAATPV
jgi:DNA-binding CsgD family transcriptional regulator